LHLDHDTKGLSGSPEIAHEIFNKIAAAAVFVADMTPVGEGPPRTNKDGKPVAPKPLMNPNVAIELGFALHALGPSKLLMILSEAYGDTAGLPFDIQHRRHPITYKLAEAATKAEIDKEKQRLMGKLVEALEPFIAAAPAEVPTDAFLAAPDKIGQGRSRRPSRSKPISRASRAGSLSTTAPPSGLAGTAPCTRTAWSIRRC
jgi:hypothetical protein